MSAVTITVNASMFGEGVTAKVTRDEDGGGQWQPSVAAGKAGSLTTRTDNDTGVATLGAGHGLLTADKVDVFWTGGRRYNMSATVAGNEVTVDGGAGDNLPAEDTAVVLCKQVVVNAAFDPDDTVALLITATRRTSIVLVDAADAALLALDLAAGECCLWWEGSGLTCPIAGNPVAALWCGNGDSVNESAVNVSVIYDATP